MKINYELIGNRESQKLIVFLHEGLGSIGQWKDFPESLCSSNNCAGFIYDRSGYGKSSGSLKNRDQNYLFQAADELNEVMATIVPNQFKEIYLYGHSDGASIALIYAAQHNKKIKGIISEAAHVFVEEETLIGVQKTLKPFNTGKLDGLKKHHGMRYKEVFMAWFNIWMSEEFRNWNIENALKSIPVPILVIQGEKDPYGTIKQVNSIVQNASGFVKELLLPNIGHAPHKESKLEVINHVTRFIHEN